MSTRKEAQELLARYWDRKLPVDPTRIAEKIGIQVKVGDLNGVSGKLDVDGDLVEISVSSKEPRLRQRFTVAHELGHWALQHGTSFRDCVDDFRLSQRAPKEVAANKFAAELLMPTEAVKEAIEGMGITALPRLANIFEVSQLAMKIRLEQLGWI